MVILGTPCPSIESITSLALQNPQSQIGLLVPLPPGPDGDKTLRAAASGFFSPSSVALLQDSAAVYLGDRLYLAAAFHVLEQAMWGTNMMIAREAFALAHKNGVDLNLLYNALGNGAAGSHAFRQLWSILIAGKVDEANRITQVAHTALAEGLALASKEVFYAPLMGLSKQAAVRRLAIRDVAVDRRNSVSAEAAIQPENPIKVGFVGLGAMGCPMALVLHKAGLNVDGYDVWEPARDAYTQVGGLAVDDVLSAAQGADVFLLIVVNAAQVEDILFHQGALAALADDAVVLVMSTVPASEARKLKTKISGVRPDVGLVDCPVSGAVPRAATGDLMVFCGGLEDIKDPVAQAKAYRVLYLLSSSQGHEEYLVRVPGGVGRGSSVKLSNQHLGGTQISNCAEIQAFAAKIGLPGRKAHKLLMSGPGWCWVLGHRGLSMLNGLITPPMSAIDIFVKDMGIVVSEAEALDVPIPLAALVQQQFVFAKSLGWGSDDDSG